MALKLKHKLLLFWMVSLTIVLGGAGALAFFLIGAQQKEAAIHSLEQGFVYLGKELTGRAAHIQKEADGLALRSNIIASLNMILGYQEIDDYQPIIFDVEKRQLAEDLADFAHATGVEMAVARDAAGRLAGFFLKESSQNLLGYLTFRDGKPQPVVRRSGSGVWKESDSLPDAVAETRPFASRMTSQTVWSLSPTGLKLEASAPVVRLFPDGRRIVAGGIYLSRRFESDWIRKVGQDAGLSFALLDGNGKRLGAVDFTHLGPLDATLRGPMEPVNTYGRTVWEDVGHSKYHLGLKRLDTLDGRKVGLLLGLERASLAAEAKALRLATLGALLLSAALLLPAGAWFLNRAITLPVERLVAGAEALQEGRFKTVSGMKNHGELGRLAASFNAMASSLETREEDLKKSERRVRLLLESTGEGIYGLDREGRCIFINPSAQRMLGRPQDELLGSDLHSLIHHSQGSGRSLPHTECRICDALRNGDEIHLEDQRFFRPDGTSFPVECRSHPMFQEERIVGCVVTFSDIAKRLSDMEELAHAKDRAETANRAKTAFLATISHEVRTPLNAILGMGELLGGTPLDETQRRFLARMEKASASLTAIIDDILEITNLEAGKGEVSREPLALAEFLADVTTLMADPAEEKGLKINLNLQPELPATVLADARKLRQILVNLIGNAIKFTERGAIDVTLALLPGRRAEALVELTVSDTGIGISAEKREAIFTYFTQADSSYTRKFGGIGLGLSICRRLAALMGGAIRVESALGQGSAFTVTLPFPLPTPARKPSALKDPKEPANDAAPARILLVEDSDENAMVVEAYLAATPHKLEIAKHGRAGLERFQTELFDLVFMDLQMPVMDGYEAVRRIRDWERRVGREKTPIIALSAHAFAEEKERCLKAGCDLHLSKPISRSRLIQAVEEAVA